MVNCNPKKGHPTSDEPRSEQYDMRKGHSKDEIFSLLSSSAWFDGCLKRADWIAPESKCKSKSEVAIHVVKFHSSEKGTNWSVSP